MREDGIHIVSDPGRDRPLSEFKTLQCVHCGAHFTVVPGSGRRRGWCTKHHGPTCGPECDHESQREHLHFMERIERIEAADARQHALAFVPALETLGCLGPGSKEPVEVDRPAIVLPSLVTLGMGG